MAVRQLNRMVAHLRFLLKPGNAGPDAGLLKRFVQQQDEAVFEALVQRHGPMVMGVCLRVLRNPDDAEDAFQATFLVLVRKASAVRPASMVGNWLYGVAYRTALKARAAAARRRGKEANVVHQAETPTEQRDDLWPLLDQELARLPQKYRSAIVHCDLEGKTRREVAEQLGWPEGTVAGRLATARATLAKRLARHGFGVSAGLLATMLGQNASACVSPSVASATVKAGMMFAAGQTAQISVKTITLTEGALKAMLLAKLKVAAVVLAIVSAVCAAGLVYQLQATEPPKAQANDSPKAPKTEKAEQKQPKEDISAKVIVDRMTKAYANCKSYRDSGIVKAVFIEADGKRTENKPFTTAFVRPDRLRFEYRQRKGDEEQYRYIIWSNGKDVQTWWDVEPGIKKPESLRLSVNAANGVSGGSSLTIPALLLPDAVGGGGGKLTNITDATRAEDGKQADIECFRVEGKYVGNPMTVWIDKKTYLVRRIDEQAKLDNFRTEQTTTFDPTIDKEITDKMLEFDPPRPK